MRIEQSKEEKRGKRKIRIIQYNFPKELAKQYVIIYNILCLHEDRNVPHPKE